MHPILKRRHAERDELIERARAHAEALASKVALEAAVVFGSVARGDFNLWSDVDLLVVVTGLPRRIPDRVGVVNDDRPARVDRFRSPARALSTRSRREQRAPGED